MSLFAASNFRLQSLTTLRFHPCHSYIIIQNNGQARKSVSQCGRAKPDTNIHLSSASLSTGPTDETSFTCGFGLPYLSRNEPRSKAGLPNSVISTEVEDGLQPNLRVFGLRIPGFSVQFAGGGVSF